MNKVKFSHKAIELFALGLLIANLGMFAFGVILILVNVAIDYIL